MTKQRGSQHRDTTEMVPVRQRLPEDTAHTPSNPAVTRKQETAGGQGQESHTRTDMAIPKKQGESQASAHTCVQHTNT